LAYPFDNDLEQREGLVKLAYGKSPEVVLKTFRRLIECDLATPQSPYKVRELAVIWDVRVAALLHEFLTKPGLSPDQTATLLEALLEHGDEAAFEFACSMVKATDNQPLALVAAKALVAHQARRSWQLIWETMCSNASFGEEMMLGLAYYPHRDSSILVSLSAPEIAELYFWLEDHFSVAKDISYPSGEAHPVTARDEVGRLRDHCPSYLSGLGTQAAIDALHSICDHFPDRDWLKYLLNQAKQALRKTTLQALSPAELIDYTPRLGRAASQKQRRTHGGCVGFIAAFAGKVERSNTACSVPVGLI